MARAAIAGAASLALAWLLHEIITFGYIHGFLTGERQLGYGIYPTSLAGIIAQTLLLSALAALLLAALALLFKASKARIPVLGVMWLGLCLWGFVQTAHGYRSDFGATWLWFEPFTELMWSAWLTPLVTILSLSAFTWGIRKT